MQNSLNERGMRDIVIDRDVGLRSFKSFQEKVFTIKTYQRRCKLTSFVQSVFSIMK